MTKKNSDISGRRAMMGGLGAAALAGVALGAAPVSAQSTTSGFTPKRHALDAWMNELPGDHRVFIDTSVPAGGNNALRYCANIMNAHINAYDGSDDEMAMIICYRHMSTALGFNDAMWQKYGEGFANITQQRNQDGSALDKNPVLRSIDGLVDRGVHFAICNAATLFFSGRLADQAGLDADDVHAELVANLVPNGHMVPAGVMAVTRAQEYGYSFLYSEA